MIKSALNALQERGFIKQVVFEEELNKKLLEESMYFYCGFDPTASSLHIGGLIPLMAMAHLQRAGHKPIVLLGGGTAMVGDPSFRDDMRSMLGQEEINHNVSKIKQQVERLLSFSGENAAIVLNNADWLLNLNYVDFIREIGAHFSVNRMLSAECFKQRLEKGLSFLEFNYMLMQGYDFLHLYEQFGCLLQIGGNDQWSNMLAGADLIRRRAQKEAYVFTLPLLENDNGEKMGKTKKGALWLDGERTSPYEFYQYFRNVSDAKVAECLRLLTFLELDHIEEITKHRDERINAAKEILAFEVTKIIHGLDAALSARTQALAAFSGDEQNMPTVELAFSKNSPVIDLICECGVTKTKSEARRLIDSKSIRINQTLLSGYDHTAAEFLDEQNSLVIHRGKKIHLKVVLL